MSPADLLARLEGGLIVSCQPVDDGPMDRVETIVAMALAARDGGAAALRIEGAENVAAVTRACALPVIGIVKRDLADSPVRITPFLDDVEALAEAGAAAIAVDATARRRPVAVAELLQAIQARGRATMADLASFAEAEAARRLGFDIIGTTLSGYTGGTVPEAPDFALVAACRALGGTVVAEGRYNSPALAAEAIRSGASAVCVGSAITRQEHITGWFRDAVQGAAAAATRTVLAIDVGGTKSLLALVRDGRIEAERTMPTSAEAIGSAAWFAELAALAAPWRGGYEAVGAAVTGLVVDGHWTALNPATLPIPPRTPLLARLREAFGCARVVAANDAQAAAWGEYRRGAGAGHDMLFLTVSSGIGGGLVLDGRLRVGDRGLAGSLGQVIGADGERFEAEASGFGLARAAAARGQPADTRALFAALDAGAGWADELVRAAAGRLAAALGNLQRLIDMELVVLGGGIGMLPAYRARVEAALAELDPVVRPRLVPARLGGKAGIIGIAEMSAAVG
jgi:N-acetylmannosamine-6-phosphate 2-epimerase/N-acetylmannosamine kinase